MAQITLNIPDAVAPRVIDDICKRFSYRPTIDGAPNPETKPQFTKRMIVRTVKEWVKDEEAAGAAFVASTTATATAETEIEIT